MVYDIGFKVVEIFLVHIWWKLQINRSRKNIELLLYRIEYSKTYDILSLMHTSVHNKVNKTDFAFFMFFCLVLYVFERDMIFEEKIKPLNMTKRFAGRFWPIEKYRLRVDYCKVQGFFS
jgi:hypothetical protein